MIFSSPASLWRRRLAGALSSLLALGALAADCTWTFVHSGRPSAFSQFQFINVQAGFAHDTECLWQTGSGGRQWARLWCSDPQAPGWRERGAIDRFEFTGIGTGWLLTRGGALQRTRDGGRTWAEQTFPGYLVRAVRFADPLHGWWVGEQPLDGIPDTRGVAFATSDGGEHWHEQALGVAAAARWRLVDVWPQSAHEAWAVGSDLLLHTQDAGASWQDRSFAELGRWRNDSIRFSRSGIGVIVRSPAQGYLLSVDAGRHWQARRTPVSAPRLDGLAFIDARQAWASIAGQIHRSLDGGRSWRPVVPGPAPQRDEPARYHGLQYIETGRLLVVAEGADAFGFCALH